MRLASVLLVLFLLPAAHADSLRVAVASSFRQVAEDIAREFSARSDHTVTLSSASTGKHFAQITNGAPFDILLAADSVRPLRLAANGLGVPGSRRTFAIGRLVLWSRDATVAANGCRKALDAPGKRRIAIAAPGIAPYGLAAWQFLEAEGLLEDVTPRLVYGESAAQALHFVATKNASFGFIAASQAQDPNLPAPTCSWPVPESTHDTLEHQAIVIASSRYQDAAAEFIAFLSQPAATDIIRRAGYRVPR